MGNVNNDNLERSLVKVNGTMKNFGDTVSSAIDQITHVSEKASSSLKQIGDTADRVSNAVGSVRDIAELYTQCVEINAAQGGLSVAGGCRCLTKELDMIAC